MCVCVCVCDSDVVFCVAAVSAAAERELAVLRLHGAELSATVAELKGELHDAEVRMGQLRATLTEKSDAAMREARYVCERDCVRCCVFASCIACLIVRDKCGDAATESGGGRGARAAIRAASREGRHTRAAHRTGRCKARSGATAGKSSTSVCLLRVVERGGDEQKPILTCALLRQWHSAPRRLGESRRRVCGN